MNTPSLVRDGPRELDWSGITRAAEKVAIAQSMHIARKRLPYPALSMLATYRLKTR
jgi:hypothetical protein